MSFTEKKHYLPILFLVSISLVGVQFSLMQTLVFSQWSHFAGMVISVAMLGFAASAIAVSLKKDFLIKNKNAIIPLSICSCSLLVVLVPSVVNSEILMFDTLLIFSQTKHFIRLITVYLYLFMIFFSGAITIVIIFTDFPLKINKLYFANLIGSGCGTILSAIMASQFFPKTSFSIFAVITALALIFATTSKKKIIPFLVVIFTLVTFNLLILSPLPGISQYKSLAKTLTLPDAEIVLSKPTSHGILNIVQSQNLRYAPGLSLSYIGEINAHSAVFVNGNIVANNSFFSKNDPSHIFQYSTKNIPFVMGNRFNRTALMYPGSYAKVALAYKNNAETIEIIEPNVSLFYINKNHFANINDSLLHSERVKFHNKSARSFLASTPHKYDLIYVNMPDAFGGSSGLFAHKPQYHLTIEAFQNMWYILDDDGFITLSCWLDYPSRTPLRIFATLANMLTYSVENPQLHIVAVKNWSHITFLVKKTPFTQHEIDSIEIFANKMMFDIVVAPFGVALQNRDKFNQVPDAAFYQIIDSIMVGNFSILDKYLFNISPTTDNNPFFLNFLRLKNLQKIINHIDIQSLAFFETGFIFSVISVIKTVLISFVLIIIPLIFFKIKQNNMAHGGIKKIILYFACLGVGYIFIEILMLQRLSYYLETHILAAPITIGTLLVSSGFGSYYSPIFAKTKKRLFLTFSLITLTILAYTFLGNSFIISTISLPLLIRCFFAIFFVSFLGFFLGIPFPSGLTAVAKKSNHLVPFAWGINGCFSVVSASVVLLISVSAGYKIVLLISILCYMLAALTIMSLIKRS